MRERRKEWDSQTIQVDDDWRIIRADEMNWEVQYKGQFKGYFGRLVNALQDIPHKMLSKQAKGSIDELIGIMRRIETEVTTAMRINKLME